MNAIVTSNLGRRWGKRWALRNLDLVIPEGAVVGLVGPNGAGKSTLLHLIVGLISATEGTLEVLGDAPGQAGVLPDIAFVAQDAPLPRRARVGDLVEMTAALNVRWEADLVAERIDVLRLEVRDRVGELSGGQRAQLALALALAKQPRLLVLDEPVASLDPLSRRAFLQSLMAAVAEGGLSVVLSTHMLDDLERVCDFLVVLGQGTRLLSGPLDEIVASHAVLVGPPDRPLPRGAEMVGGPRPRGHQTLVSLRAPVLDPAWQQLTPGLDEIVLAHLESEAAPVTPAPQRLAVV